MLRADANGNKVLSDALDREERIWLAVHKAFGIAIAALIIGATVYMVAH